MSPECGYLQRLDIRFPEAGLQAILSHLTWVLGTELRPSGKGISTFNHGAISLSPT